MQNFEINSTQIDKIEKITIKEKNFRVKNLESFKNMGFPNKRLEDWKFSDFKDIVNKNFKELDTKKASSDISKIDLLKDFEHNYILLVNGNLHSSNFKYESLSAVKVARTGKRFIQDLATSSVSISIPWRSNIINARTR